jgi:hypothetical protein
MRVDRAFLETALPRLFKERPASVQEAGDTFAKHMLAEPVGNITCPSVQFWAEAEDLAICSSPPPLRRGLSLEDLNVAPRP